MRTPEQQWRSIADWKTLEPNLPENKEISMKTLLALGMALTILVAIAVMGAKANATEDKKTVAALDTEYQAAVEKNDVATMDRILADDFVLVTGSGKSYTKADLLNEARSKRTIYERQADSEQTVRVWGDTAVVTAKLWSRGTREGQPFEHTLCFSDTYVRTATGWRYVFGQASLPLPVTS
jgi:ketosteroid isomerase-like protein